MLPSSPVRAAGEPGPGLSPQTAAIPAAAGALAFCALFFSGGFADAPLVRGIDERKKIADRHGLNVIARHELRECVNDPRLVQRLDFRSVDIDALVDPRAQPARRYRRPGAVARPS